MLNSAEVKHSITVAIPSLLVAILPTFAALLILVLINALTGIRVSVFMRDAVQVMDAPFYTGLYSNIGILLWAATTAITLFAASLVQERDWKLFLWGGGLITAFFLLDDLLIFHEVVFPQYLGIPEIGVPLIYAVMLGFFVLRFRRQLPETEWIVPLMTLFLFAVSVLVDLSPEEFHGIYLIEDGAKLLGIALWATYFIKLAGKLICNTCGLQAVRE